MLMEKIQLKRFKLQKEKRLLKLKRFKLQKEKRLLKLKRQLKRIRLLK